MQLTRTIVKELEKDKKWIQAILSNIDRLAILINIGEEPGEIIITLLMKDEEIERAVVEATKKVLGNNVKVSEVSVSSDGSTIRFLLNVCS